MVFQKGAAGALAGLGPARVFVVGALVLLVMEGVVTPASGFAACASSFGLGYKTGLGGNPLVSSMACSYGGIALARRDSVSWGSSKSKSKGRPGWRVEKVSAYWCCSTTTVHCQLRTCVVRETGAVLLLLPVVFCRVDVRDFCAGIMRTIYCEKKYETIFVRSSFFSPLSTQKMSLFSICGPWYAGTGNLETFLKYFAKLVL